MQFDCLAVHDAIAVESFCGAAVEHGEHRAAGMDAAAPGAPSAEA